jgi:hypothetical protein
MTRAMAEAAKARIIVVVSCMICEEVVDVLLRPTLELGLLDTIWNGEGMRGDISKTPFEP